MPSYEGIKVSRGDMSPYNERIRKYSLLVAKEKEVREKLEKAKKLMMTFEDVVSDSRCCGPRLRHSFSLATQQLTASPSFQRCRSLSDQVKAVSANSLSALNLKSKHRSVSFSGQEYKAKRYGSLRSQLSLDNTAECTTCCPSPNLRKTGDRLRQSFEEECRTSNELSRSRERIVEARQRANSRLERIKSLDEDCQKAKQLINMSKSMSLNHRSASCSSNESCDSSLIERDVFTSPACIV